MWNGAESGSRWENPAGAAKSDVYENDIGYHDAEHPKDQMTKCWSNNYGGINYLL